MDSLTASPSSSYLPFPPELRNKILFLALTGGHVYLRSSFSSQKLSHKSTSANSSFKSAPAVNLLATCRQAYDEGHVMFYSENVFHLPRGRCAEMEKMLAKIKPEHLAMMKYVVLRLSPLDLTPSVLLELEEASPTSSLVYDIGAALFGMWLAKLSHAPKCLCNLKEARVRLSQVNKFGDEASIMTKQGAICLDKWGLILNPITIDTNFLQEDIDSGILNIFASTAARFCSTIGKKIERREWEDFKSLLSLEGVTIHELAGRHLQDPEWSTPYWREIDIEMSHR